MDQLLTISLFTYLYYIYHCSLTNEIGGTNYNLRSLRIHFNQQISFPLFHSQGEHGINEEVYLSLPCVLTANGVSHIVKQILTEPETKKLQDSARVMQEVQVGLKFWANLNFCVQKICFPYLFFEPPPMHGLTLKDCVILTNHNPFLRYHPEPNQKKNKKKGKEKYIKQTNELNENIKKIIQYEDIL